MATRDEERTKPRRLVSSGVLVYQQVAAIIATFALIAFVSHFFDIEWRGFIGNLVGQWNEYIRPAMAWLLHILVTMPLGLLGWHVEVPLLLRDYLAVGLVLALSRLREVRRQHRRNSSDSRFVWREHLWPFNQSRNLYEELFGAGVKPAWRFRIHSGLRTAFDWPPGTVLAWPVKVLVDFHDMVRDRKVRRSPLADDDLRSVMRRYLMAQFLSLSPLIYFGVLLAANYLIP